MNVDAVDRLGHSLREQIIFSLWRAATVNKSSLQFAVPDSLALFKQVVPANYPDPWRSWVIHRIDLKLQEDL